jgi:uncharacterized repeat protein (TIGR03843 family)
VSRHERTPQATGLTEPPRALLEGGMEVLGLMPNSSNYTFLARCRCEGEEVLAIYKPRRGEIPLWDFPDGTLHRREVAAYELARALGWPNIPPTVLREGPEGKGSAQLFVAVDPEQHFFTLQDERADDFRLVALFDVVANNADRKGGHCLLGEDGLIWAIDHGVCFSDEPKLRTVIWDFIGEPIPEGARTDLERVGQDLARDGSASRSLAPLLAPVELRALEERLGGLLRDGVFPEPIPGARPYPWPPI